MFSNLGLAAWLAAKRRMQTFQFPHVPCQPRHLLLDAPAAPALEGSKYAWQLLEFNRREEKPSFPRSAPLWAWQQTKIALGKKIYPAVWWALGLPLVLVAAWLFIETTFRHLAGALRVEISGTGWRFQGFGNGTSLSPAIVWTTHHSDKIWTRSTNYTKFPGNEWKKVIFCAFFSMVLLESPSVIFSFCWQSFKIYQCQ